MQLDWRMLSGFADLKLPMVGGSAYLCLWQLLLPSMSSLTPLLVSSPALARRRVGRSQAAAI